MCRSKHVEQLRNIGIINSTIRSHLVGYFYKIYIMMQGSINIKFEKIIVHLLGFTIEKQPQLNAYGCSVHNGAQKKKSMFIVVS